LAEAEAARLAAEASARDAEERSSQLRGRLAGIERSLLQAQRERDEARADLVGERARAQALESGNVDIAARATAEAAQAKLIAGYAHEQARLRAELDERDRRVQAIERERPPKADVDRARTESEQLRARLAELDLELKRKDSVIERTASAAAHERARSERLVASERQTLAERNDARARSAEVNARVAALEAERDRLAAAVAVVEAKLHKAENEIEERRERIRKLKRELADSERRAEAGILRARTLEAVRARVLALEAAVAGEAQQLAGIEEALRST
jgi:chromosome segregation protein